MLTESIFFLNLDTIFLLLKSWTWRKTEKSILNLSHKYDACQCLINTLLLCLGLSWQSTHITGKPGEEPRLRFIFACFSKCWNQWVSHAKGSHFFPQPFISTHTCTLSRCLLSREDSLILPVLSHTYTPLSKPWSWSDVHTWIKTTC